MFSPLWWKDTSENVSQNNFFFPKIFPPVFVIVVGKLVNIETNMQELEWHVRQMVFISRKSDYLIQFTKNKDYLNSTDLGLIWNCIIIMSVGYYLLHAQ